MDALLNEERFLQVHHLYRLTQDDDSDDDFGDDVACEAEMGECFLPLTARSRLLSPSLICVSFLSVDFRFNLLRPGIHADPLED